MSLLGKAVRWVRAGVKSLRQLKDTPMLWQGGFTALQGMIQEWPAGSRRAALRSPASSPLVAHAAVRSPEKWADPSFIIYIAWGYEVDPIKAFERV